jgi:phenylalanyl-tRNA synthetase beta chain
MKVSIDWLNELVELNGSVEDLVELLPLRSIGTKEVTADFIELDMKGYNRADLLSMRGVAYEVAAITDSKLKFEEEEVDLDEKSATIDVEIQHKKDCPIYLVAQIDGVKVGKSNPDTIKKLADSGIRAVNNVVDITNLIMLEYGQPLHAFDGRVCTNRNGNVQIGVRRAMSDESIQTLDEKDRVLMTEDIVIVSGQQVIGIAGVMGGKVSEVSDQTTTIVLEAAIFDPRLLRKTANRLSIHSEAAKRFYHGLTEKRLLQAFAKAIKELEKLGGKVVGIKKVGDYPAEKIDINVEVSKINALVGLDLGDDFIIQSLRKLYFEVEKSGDMLTVRPPYFRLDCRIGVDIVEEVARMYGYEKIPAKELAGETPEKIDQTKFEFEQKLRASLVELGFNEVLTYSFVGSKIIEAMEWTNDSMVKVANPISSETEYLRRQIWPNLVSALISNLKFRKSAKIFEIGKTYSAIDGEIIERRVVSLAWADDGDDPFAALSGVFEALGGMAGVKWTLQANDTNNNLHPVRQVRVLDEDQIVGVGGEVNMRLIDTLGGNKRIAIIEVRI